MKKTRIGKICLYCKKPFKVIPSLARLKYCSQFCYWNIGRETVICFICKKKFIYKKCYKRKLCSFKCRNKYSAKIKPMLGYKHSLETKRLISLKSKGHPPNSGSFKKGNKTWSTGKKRLDMERSKHWNWRGGITKEFKVLRQSLEYKQWRKSVFERDNYICIWCGAKSQKGIRVYLQADHIKPFAFYPKLRFDITNGRTLCLLCHSKTKTYKNGSLGRDNRGKFYSLPEISI